MNLVERFRGYAVSEALRLGSFQAHWPGRRDYLKKRLSRKDGRAVVELGRHLSDVYRMVAGSRGQSDVSGGGATWQALVLFYLNMVYAGTDAVAVAAKSAPPSVKKALRVSYQGASVLGDLDVALLVLPGSSQLPDPVAPMVRRQRLAAQRQYWELFDAQFKSAYVSIVACKTNWNDTVQTPMLWNLLYTLRREGKALPGGLAIGDGGFSLDELAGFAFSFVTVPTNKLELFKTSYMPVQRSRAFSGSYFWGYPAKPGVVDNISSFPDRHASNSTIVPRSSVCGIAFAAEITKPTGVIDIDAFQWS